MDDREKDAQSNVRFFSGLRFGQFTVFLATSGGLIKMFFDNSGFPRILFAPTGIVVTVVFFVINFRARDRVETSRKRAKQLRPPIPKWREKLTATNATYFLYGYVFFAWIILLIISAVQLLRPVVST